MYITQVEPTGSGSVVEVTVPGSAICCRRPMAHLVGAVQDAVLRTVGDYVGNHPAAPLPVVRLFLRPPRLLFALEPDRWFSPSPKVNPVSNAPRPCPRP